jgi:hypothetical protein
MYTTYTWVLIITDNPCHLRAQEIDATTTYAAE